MASLYSTSPPGALPLGVMKSTQPSTSPSARIGTATDRQNFSSAGDTGRVLPPVSCR